MTLWFLCVLYGLYCSSYFAIHWFQSWNFLGRLTGLNFVERVDVQQLSGRPRNRPSFTTCDHEVSIHDVGATKIFPTLPGSLKAWELSRLPRWVRSSFCHFYCHTVGKNIVPQGTCLLWNGRSKIASSSHLDLGCCFNRSWKSIDFKTVSRMPKMSW